MRFVLDASVTLAWHFEDERAERAEALARRAATEGVIVPAHWQLEVANGLLSGERIGRTDTSSIASFIERLTLISLEVEALGPGGAFNAILPHARAHALTIYDAIYLHLAERRGAALATFDKALAAAAASIGVELL